MPEREQKITPEAYSGEFDPTLAHLTQEDWKNIETEAELHDSAFFDHIIGAIAQLDRDRALRIIREEDWERFFEHTRIKDKNEIFNADYSRQSYLILRRPGYIAQMARVDQERAKDALYSGELDDKEKIIQDILKEQDRAVPPENFGKYIDFLSALDPQRVKGIFENNDSAWGFIKEYVAYLRSPDSRITLMSRDQNPPGFFTFLSALAELDSERIQELLQKSDWQLVREGLEHYRRKAHESPQHNSSPLAEHAVKIKKLLPGFGKLFSGRSPE